MIFQLKMGFKKVIVFTLWCVVAYQTVTTQKTLAPKTPEVNHDAEVHTNSSHKASNLTALSRPSGTQSLLYGLLATTVVNLAALIGSIFTPAHRFSWYPVLISFMVATAVGSLFSTAILVLIPEALGLVSNPKDEHDYEWISVTVCAGAFSFFVLEFLLRRLRTCLNFLTNRRSTRQSHLSLNECLPGTCNLVNSYEMNHNVIGDMDARSPSMIVVNGGVDGHGAPRIMERSKNDSVGHTSPREPTEVITLCGPNTCRRIAGLDPVVWMIVIGDGMHNLMDGLSMGAGFARDLRLGFSLSLAILCEELPHELGDIAIMLRSGLSVGMAVLFNLISAFTAYIGFFLGLYLGELKDAASYIFAITAGFFLYISLTDMLPEMRKTEDERLLLNGSAVGLFFVHAFGLLFGFGCILAVTLLSEFISL